MKIVQRVCEHLAEFRGIWQLPGQTTQLLHRRLTLLLGRVSLSRSG